MPVLRKLFPAEWDRYERHLLRLDPHSRLMRFAGNTSDAAITQRCRTLDHGRTVIVGCFVQGELRGAVEIAVDRTLWPRDAELAFSLEAPFQGLGLGAVLMERALTIVRNRRIRRIHMLCLHENRRMRALVRRFGGALTFDGGELLAVFDLPPPNHLSLAVEAMEDGAGAVGAWLSAIAPTERFAA
ncbi:GNAT family N-acetyltransferase [Azospirillum halopraeferens]|uniref:GNAT family N-acetyltransferase n=1 Tax=Azospirillum halopraeferens TaxID=34010 RepID=UPI0004148D94|nr:GNAT family N-acetyltransferase [Azospirillum halopraeferens]